MALAGKNFTGWTGWAARIDYRVITVQYRGRIFNQGFIRWRSQPIPLVMILNKKNRTNRQQTIR